MAYLLKNKYESMCSELVLLTVKYLYFILCELIMSIARAMADFYHVFFP